MAKKLPKDKLKVAIDIDGDGKPDLSLDLKTIILLVTIIASTIGMYYSLESEIQEAKNLPVPEIQAIEFHMKDEAIRAAILHTEDDLKEIKAQLITIDERLYELQQNH